MQLSEVKTQDLSRRGAPVPRLVMLLILFAALPTAVLWGLFAWSDYKRTLAVAEGELHSLVVLMEEHVRAMMVLNTVQLERVAEQVGPRHPGALRDSQADFDRVQRLVAEVPGGHSLWLFDADANLTLTNLGRQYELNVADRAYFTAVKPDGAGLFISPLIWGKLLGGHYFAVSRRLTDAEGRFNGAVQLSTNAGHLLELYGALTKHDDSSFSIFKPDGSVVFRAPLPEREPPKLPADGPLMRQLAAGAPEGILRVKSFGQWGNLGKPDRILAYRRMSDYPLILTVTRKEDAVLAPWSARTLQNGLLALTMVLLLLAVGLLAARSARREAAANAGLAAKAAQLARALADKDLLFQEVHHRIKNNLQMVGSMLTMQSLMVGDDRARAALQDALTRIQTMGLVHQTLYQGNEAADVDVAAYLTSLIEVLRQSYGTERQGVTLRVEADAGRIDLDRAIPLALICTEALTNALKHAFTEGRGGTVIVRFEAADDRRRLVIADDGAGMPAGLADGNGGSLGVRLIRSLARQIGGDVRFLQDGGTRVEVSFAAAEA